MRIDLLAYTPNCERLIAAAAKVTIARRSFEEVWNTLTEEEVEAWIRETALRGHTSPWEHCSYTFYVEGVSRVLSHQLVRHRIASYSQQSQRFKALRDLAFFVPPSAKEGERVKRVFEEALDACSKAYFELVSLGVAPEDARYVLPQAVETRLVVTMNARELMHFLSLRACRRAQAEIRALAWLMWKKVREVHPRLWRWAGPRCVQLENMVRRSPLTIDEYLNGAVKLVSERCPEGVPGESVPSCVRQAYEEALAFASPCESLKCTAGASP